MILGHDMIGSGSLGIVLTLSKVSEHVETLKGDGLVFPPIEPKSHSVQVFQVGLNQ